MTSAPLHTCSDNQPNIPSVDHYAWHRRNKTDPCPESRYSASWYVWVQNNPCRDQNDYHTINR